MPSAISDIHSSFTFVDNSPTVEVLRPEHDWEPVMQTTLDHQLLTPLDWHVLREARLEALRESPRAFTSSHAHELGWEEAQWRLLFDSATWIIAREAENVIGLARSVGEPERPSARHVESIWVAPKYRRRGVLRGLLHSLAELERQMGVTDLLLWVLEDNHEARRAYEALGFKPTGESQFLPVVRRCELRLRLHICWLQDSLLTTRPFRLDYSGAKARYGPIF